MVPPANVTPKWFQDLMTIEIVEQFHLRMNQPIYQNVIAVSADEDAFGNPP